MRLNSQDNKAYEKSSKKIDKKISRREFLASAWAGIAITPLWKIRTVKEK